MQQSYKYIGIDAYYKVNQKIRSNCYPNSLYGTFARIILRNEKLAIVSKIGIYVEDTLRRKYASNFVKDVTKNAML